MKTVRKILRISTVVFATILLIGAVSLFLILEPSFKLQGNKVLDESTLTNINKTVTILDSDGEIIDNQMYASNKIFTSITDINPHTVNAFLCTEDKRFYSHSGVDYLRILSAVKNNLLSGSYKEGASTITQQLVKNTHLSSSKKLSRKINEIRIAKELERKFTKNQILEMYFNILYFGSNIYGIGSASSVMFNKSPLSLLPHESATLCAIINNPSYFSPYTNPDNCLKRRNLILKLMLDNNKLSTEEYNKSINCELKVNEFKSNNNQFISDVIESASKVLNYSEEKLYAKNVVIKTNYRQNIQTMCDIILQNSIKIDEIYAGAIVINNLNGGIVAYSSYNNSNLNSVKRSPGSTIKPILCYLPALEKRLIVPISQLDDSPITYGDYTPSNYNDKYYGYISAEKSLQKSSNICATKLLDMSGLSYAKSIAKNCGYNFDSSDNSLALALGGMKYGLSLKEIATGYQVLGNNGNKIDSSSIDSIVDSYGTILYKRKIVQKKVVSHESAYLLNSMLKTVVTDGTASKLKGLSSTMCGKTGTVGTKEGNSDAYSVAYTPEYTVAVWIGSKDNNLLHNYTGGGTPTSIASKIFKALDIKNPIEFFKPGTIVEKDISLIELNDNHRVMIASDSTPLRYKKSAELILSNLPPVAKDNKATKYNNNNNDSYKNSSKTFIGAKNNSTQHADINDLDKLYNKPQIDTKEKQEDNLIKNIDKENYQLVG